ncbi:MAG: nicotinic acid mononucleotide adenylyltransferase [Flavobacteriales bacterium]|nr:nicotinic acid mononucleotide adenylyltransferase [Flavobacteriales bacterium]|tara:strand:- start:843 stop:1418 length:576 start_codon:yes stop_codon:yes gene_type:complete
MKVGLFFGTYNPVHVGHMVIANYMLEFTDLDQLWMVVTPQNPFKQKESMLKDYDRLHLVKLAIGDNLKMKASDIEFGLPQPNYTSNTLAYLEEKFPDNQFVLIMGADNLQHFPKWKNHEHILNAHELYVYPRLDSDGGGDLSFHKKVKMVDAPIMKISSSFIRKAISQGKDVSHYMPDAVAAYIKEMNLYR